MSENISSTRCMTTRLCNIEDKLDYIIKKLDNIDGLRGFGINVAANIIGNMFDGGGRR